MAEAQGVYGVLPGETRACSILIDRKVKYLAQIAAKDAGLTFAMFVELAMRQALQRQDLDSEENTTMKFTSISAGRFHYEGYWHEDAVERFILLATGMPHALTQRALKVWNEAFRLAKQADGLAEIAAIRHVLITQFDKHSLSKGVIRE